MGLGLGCEDLRGLQGQNPLKMLLNIILVNPIQGNIKYSKGPYPVEGLLGLLGCFLGLVLLAAFLVVLRLGASGVEGFALRLCSLVLRVSGNATGWGHTLMQAMALLAE